MINNDNEQSTDSVTSKPSSTTIPETDSTIMLPITNPTDEDLLNQNESQEEANEDDEFIRITAAHQMLTEAQTYDEQKKYPAALHLYRICVDLLLEELMFTEGTEHSRVYLRDKCTAIMDRIDVLKTMLDPIPPEPTTTIEEQTTTPPTDQLNSLHLS